jgi:hypothetical protein
MDEQKSFSACVAETTAKLARNNINILDVKYDRDGTIIGILFEYGWRITPVSVKWTRSFMEPHNIQADRDWALISVFEELLDLVKDIRDCLEG